MNSKSSISEKPIAKSDSGDLDLAGKMTGDVSDIATASRDLQLPIARKPDESHARDSQVPYWLPVLTNGQSLALAFLICGWGLAVAYFWSWWLQHHHVVTITGFCLNSVLLFWIFFAPGYFLFFLPRMRSVNPRIQIPSDWRVAMITTRAPSEPFQLVKVTLEQMLAQVTPHDTWLADEDPTSEVFDWCKEKGVRVCSRRNIEEYHRASWPRRTKCKEGNLAYFYDHYGYRDYDFVVQLDADHVPSSGYLEAMLRPFVDPTLGYVSAPSICDSNAQLSWSARGRLYAEAFVHGPLQAGYSNRFAPLCFGSHYAVRTTALREIGGLGPELAEDHSTTLMMNSFGWDGVHALDAEAHGEGPPTFADCVTQEFQWSRSLMVLFLTELPKHWRWLPLRKKIQFLFCEAWYPLFSVSILIGLLLPTIAIIRAESWVNVSYVQFLLHSLPVFVVFFLIQVVLKNSGALRPKDTPLFSWEAALFMLVRWPWSLWGTLMGIRMALTSQNVTFRVTPKGETPPRSLEWKILVPYIAIVTLPSLLTLSVESAGEASGYFFFVLMAQFFYTVSLILLVYLHFHESRKEIRG